MFNRLVAENIIKTPFKGQPYFSINKKLLAYSQQQSLKLKGFNKDIKDSQITLQNNQKIKHFQFSLNNTWLSIINTSNTLQIYEIETQYCQKISKIITINGVSEINQSEHTFILTGTDGYYKILLFSQLNQLKQKNVKQIQIESLHSMHKKSQSTSIIAAPECTNIYVKDAGQSSNNNVNVFVYSLNCKLNKYQRALQIDYLHNPIAVYKNRYILQSTTISPNKNSIQIFDTNQSKQIGSFAIQGQFRYVNIKQNILLLIMSVQNNDNYWFFMLNNNLNVDNNINQSFITHKITYQKAKADFYQIYHMKTQQILSLNDKKKKIINHLSPQILDNTTSSVIYILNKQKQKVQIVKFQHSKLLESSFIEEKSERKMSSNTIKNKHQEQRQNQTVEKQRIRIKSSLEHKTHGKTLEETQKRFVEAIVDNKINIVLKKFQQLQQRVEKLQKTIKGIYQKIQENLKDINRKQIKQSVQNLFEQLTPQFQKYFSQLFKQVSGVLDQGVNFYNKKLAVEAQIHKQALSQIVTKTFQSTKQIIQLSKKEEKLSEKTENTLNDLLQSRTKWQKKTEEFQQQNKQLAFTTKGPKQSGQGKVFIRADLNLSGRKQT